MAPVRIGQKKIAAEKQLAPT